MSFQVRELQHIAGEVCYLPGVVQIGVMAAGGNASAVKGQRSALQRRGRAQFGIEGYRPTWRKV